MFVVRCLHLHQDLCQLCYQQLTMDNEQGGARRKTAEQAERWVEKSRNRLS